MNENETIWVHLAEVLQRYGEYFVNKAKEEILKGKHNASGNLTNSLNFKVDLDDGHYSVTVYLEDYWKYLNEGTGPQHEPEPRKQYYPPLSAMKAWVEVKHILPETITLKDGTHPTKKQLPYVMQSIIHKYGTRATHFFDTAKEDTEEYFRESIYNAICEDMGNYVSGVLRDNRLM